MKTAVITAAGISSRFNVGVPEKDRKLKAIYSESDSKNTLLYHLLQKCIFADWIIIVGGYKFKNLTEYCEGLEQELQKKICLVFNEYYEGLASGYSLYLGLQESFKYGAEEIVFVEGDLDIDHESFKKVIQSEKSVLTYTYEPIYANKAVVLYKDCNNKFCYLFNAEHGLLSIKSPFSCILNSGQFWKFTEMEVLKNANRQFFEDCRDGTNLYIIQKYLDAGVEVELVGLKQWTNCNTKEDYKKIVNRWENCYEDVAGKTKDCGKSYK